MIVSKARIIEEYARVFMKFKNDALRFAHLSQKLGVPVTTIIETVNENG